MLILLNSTTRVKNALGIAVSLMGDQSQHRFGSAAHTEAPAATDSVEAGAWLTKKLGDKDVAVRGRRGQEMKLSTSCFCVGVLFHHRKL